jgi:RNA polymerase sigma factor (TIGR02999 family)
VPCWRKICRPEGLEIDFGPAVPHLCSKVSTDIPITELLSDGRDGDREALDRLAAAVYPELRRLAGAYLRRESKAETLQPTALVNEAYVRVLAQGLPHCESRGQFYALVAHRMRQVLVDHARGKKSEKRGGGLEALPLDEERARASEKDDGILALDEALKALERLDARKHSVIELRFFAGLSVEETAEALGISVATVGREQRLAQAWLHRELSG